MLTTDELLQLETEYEDRRRYQETQEEIDYFDTKGEYVHTEIKDQVNKSNN